MHTGAAMMTDPPPAWGILLVVVLTLFFVHAYPHAYRTQEGINIYVLPGTDNSVTRSYGSKEASTESGTSPALTQLPAPHVRCVPHALPGEELLCRRRPPSTRSQPSSRGHQQEVLESVRTGSEVRPTSHTEPSPPHTDLVLDDLSCLH